MMIKQINISNMAHLELQLNKAKSAGFSHFIPYSNEIKINQDMLEAVALSDNSVAVDYTIDGMYLNDCRYFGDDKLTFISWMKNINHYPNFIYNIDATLLHLAKYDIHSIMDLAVITALKNEIDIDGHVVFDFNNEMPTSKAFWKSLDTREVKLINHFDLNKLAYIHGHSVPFNKFRFPGKEDEMRFAESWLVTTKFKLPKWMYKKMHQRAVKNHRNLSYVYDKDKSQVKNHIVFLGFDYGYRGNSKYLFNYFVKRNPTTEAYFITNDRRGPYFLPPEAEGNKELIESAKIVVVESYMPDEYKPNGTVIQLWHGTPIKKLFLDSHEPDQNKNIYNYKARKYNKWLQQDYFLLDSANSQGLFETAFPNQNTQFIPYGYPRISHLLHNLNDQSHHKKIKDELGIERTKPVLLYAPTWHASNREDSTLTITPELLEQYDVVYKGHVESKAQVPEEVIEAPSHIETQDLLLIADVVLTDYSSIIFDALTIGKKVCLYTPNHEAYEDERGVYEDVMQSLSKVWYTDEDLLLNNLINHTLSDIPHHPLVNENNQSLKKLTQLMRDILNDNH
ncbi:CDP-glycerol glycerophosphotransferase family protein [Staphylococcus petrasii]